MNIVYCDKYENRFKYFNGEYYLRPFVGDLVVIDDMAYEVLSVMIDYDLNEIVAIVD